VATLSALYVATEDAERLIDALCAHAAETGGQPVASGRLDNDAAFYDSDAFFETFGTRPRTFAVGVQEAGWVTVHVGTFENLGELADALSAQFDVRVVVGQGQTTSEAWRVSVHEKGRSLRHVEYADGDWVTQEGTPLAFESQPLGTNIAEPGDEPAYDFGFDEATAYCNELGFQFWSDRQPEHGWVWIRGGEPAATPSGGARRAECASDAPRSWWRRLFGP
jgi:hypothetical protein